MKWKKVDSELTKGAKEVKKMLFTDQGTADEAEKKEEAAKPAAPPTVLKDPVSQNSPGFAASLNRTWDNALGAVNKMFKSDSADEKKTDK